MKLYKFVPIADVKLEELEDYDLYHCKWVGNKGDILQQLILGLSLKSKAYVFHNLEILIPYTLPEQKVISDEEIYAEAEKRI